MKIGTYIKDISLCQIENTTKSFKVLDSEGVKTLVQFPILPITDVIRENNSVLVYSTAEYLRFDFASQSLANQIGSLIHWVKDDPTRKITDLGTCSSREDKEAPVMHFKPIVKLNDVVGTWSSTFSGTFSAGWTYSEIISKRDLIDQLITQTSDNRDGVLTLTESNIFIYTNSSFTNYISGVGAYYITFDVSDRAGNSIDSNLTINLTISSS